jgi:hypothetical protein
MSAGTAASAQDNLAKLDKYLFGGPTGVGGWLKFFCVSLTILGPLLFLAHMSSLWDKVEPTFHLYPAGLKTAIYFESIAGALIVLYGFVVGCKIWAGNPAGNKLAKQYLLVSLFGSIGIETVSLILMLDLPTEVVADTAVRVVVVLIMQGICFLVWWLYFKKSKRVRNTYGATCMDSPPLPVSLGSVLLAGVVISLIAISAKQSAMQPAQVATNPLTAGATANRLAVDPPYWNSGNLGGTMWTGTISGIKATLAFQAGGALKVISDSPVFKALAPSGEIPGTWTIEGAKLNIQIDVPNRGPQKMSGTISGKQLLDDQGKPLPFQQVQ